MTNNKRNNVSDTQIIKDANAARKNGSSRTNVDVDRLFAAPVDGEAQNPSVRFKPTPKSYRGFLQQGTMKVSAVAGAGVVTVGLLGLMMGLIADEFEPQDTVELAAFEINPKSDDVPLLTERTPPKLLDEIEVPPPPPRVDIPITDRPSEPVTRTDNPDVIFNPTPFIKTMYKITRSDADPTPLVRVPPTMPLRADRSGYCRVSFDISPEGTPYNVQASICSQKLFEGPAIRSVRKWVYRPEIQNGLAVTRTGLETVIRFNLMDDRGVLIPE